MPYSDDRFLKGWFNYRSPKGEFVSVEQFTYESHSFIYDVLPRNGQLLVRVNCGKWSNLITDWKPAHYAVCDHFNLKS